MSVAGKGVHTPELRCSFVPKLESECGDGKEFNMEVTLDELAEILYRVKDAWFTSGSYIIEDGEWVSGEGATGDGTVEVALSLESMPDEKRTGAFYYEDPASNGNTEGGWRRGYCERQAESGVSVSANNFGEPYANWVVWNSLYAPTQPDTYYHSSGQFSHVLHDDKFMDLLPQENCMWQMFLDVENNESTVWQSCAFNHQTYVWLNIQYAG